MIFIFFVGFVLNLCFGIYFSFFSFDCLKNEKMKRIFFMILLIGISFLVSSLFYFLWAFEIVSFNNFDFSLISAVIVLFKIVIVLLILSTIFDNNHLLYFLLFYSLVVLSFFLSVNLSGVVFLTSFLILLLISLIVFSRKEFERVGVLGVFYSFVSGVLFLILFFGLGNLVYIILALNILLFLFLFESVTTVKKNPFILLKRKSVRFGNSFVMDFLKYFVFIVVLANFVFIATVSVHELGHYTPAQFLDCGSTKIVYESGLPHTEILCQSDNPTNYLIALLGGFILPIVISLFFFFSGGTFIREIGLLIVGFNFVVSYKDLIDVGFSDIISLFVSVIGILCVIIAIGLLASSRVEERKFLEFSEGYKTFYKKGGN